MSRKISVKEAQQSVGTNGWSFTANPCNDMPTLWDSIGSYATDPDPWWATQMKIQDKDNEIQSLQIELMQQRGQHIQQLGQIQELHQRVDQQDQQIADIVRCQENREKELVALLIRSTELYRQHQRFAQSMHAIQIKSAEYAKMLEHHAGKVESLLQKILAPLDDSINVTEITLGDN